MKLWKKRSEEHEIELLTIVPPRTGERTLLGIENLLQALAVEEAFSLEIAGTADGVSFLVRTRSPVVFRQQLAIHYPQARIRTLRTEEDPLRPGEGEQAFTRVLTLARQEFLPLRTFRDDDLLDAGSDPLLAVLGALSTLNSGQRLGARLVLRSLGPSWSEQYQRRSLVPPLSPVLNPSYQYQTRPLKMEEIGMILLMGLVFLGLQNHLWLRDGMLIRAILLDTAIACGVVAAMPLLWRWYRNSSRIYDQRLMQEKISRPAYLTAIVPEEADSRSADNLLHPLATAFHHYDHASGNAFRDGGLRAGPPEDPLAMVTQRPWRGRSVLNTREVATLWHPPGAGTRCPCWNGLEPAPSIHWRGASGRALPWASRSPAAASGASTSPTTCSGSTTSTWQKPAWASPPSCSTWSPTSCGPRPRGWTATPSSWWTPTATWCALS